MKTKSGKAKARRLQNYVAECLQRDLSLLPEDCRPAIMGETGSDIKLSRKGREKIGLAIECKNTERLDLWGSLSQAEENAKKDELPACVIFTRNRAKTYAAIELDTLLWLLTK